MKEFFKKVWEFIKRLFHIGKKAIQEEFEEAKKDLKEQLRDELAAIEKEIESATGEALDILQARAKVVYSKILLEMRDDLKK